MKSAEEWLGILQAANTGSRTGNVYVPTIAQIEAIQLDARNSALREAAEVVTEYARKMRGAHRNTNDSCGDLQQAILALIK